MNKEVENKNNEAVDSTKEDTKSNDISFEDRVNEIVKNIISNETQNLKNDITKLFIENFNKLVTSSKEEQNKDSTQQEQTNKKERRF